MGRRRGVTFDRPLHLKRDPGGIRPGVSLCPQRARIFRLTWGRGPVGFLSSVMAYRAIGKSESYLREGNPKGPSLEAHQAN